MHSSIAVYPTPLANLNEAFERLIQSPCGCFDPLRVTITPVRK